ncbi:hypothetical protein C8N46_101270 [Kordia periserrulae]|uniref:Uncharacterized protein n=1 Tax=Kordia periserrulae TaxID=701523 RepID=A0A2T6C5S3_9FLAO|nr:hypothetical protein [Kordia periserrulae]PTX63668.1 hypothetical protein C8N46_101270 [Kordia periserrulae]
MKEKKSKDLLLKKKTICKMNSIAINGGKLPTTKQTSLEKTFCLCVG